MGAVGMTAMSYGMVVLGIDGSIQTIVLGVIIVLIMAYTTNKAKMAALLSRFFKRPETQMG